MNFNFHEENLSDVEKNNIEKILSYSNNNISTDLEQIWYLMDSIWDSLKCDNRKLNWDTIGEFYSHPIWLLNGLFIEQDETSMGHRHVISDWVSKQNFSRVLDYGGGFGTLARLIAQKNSKIVVDIYEPHPSEFGLKRAAQFTNINMIDQLNRKYDCLLSTDVLEHVPDPLVNFSKMVDSVEVGGKLVIANCFFPVIKCHLPQTFHFRYTFNFFARAMGLTVEKKLAGSHATIYQKVTDKDINWMLIRVMEILSKMIFPPFEVLKKVYRFVKRIVR